MKGDSTNAKPQRQCDNVSCTNNVYLGGYQRGVVCSGCLEAQYCGPQCQEASWESHKSSCTVTASVDLKRIHLCVKKNEDDEEELEYFDEFDDDDYMPAIMGVAVDIEYTDPETNSTVKVGDAFLQVIDIAKALSFPYGFFGCLDENSEELAHLALQFDEFARLRPNSGCWQPADFDEECYLVVLPKLVVDVPWRGCGIGGSIFPKLFQLEELQGSAFIFAWPAVLNYLEPDGVNGCSGKLTAEEKAAYLAKGDRIVKFFQKSAFRRLINSELFCLAKDTTHASHSIPIDQDAPYQDPPPPKTKEERIQRILAEMM